MVTKMLRLSVCVLLFSLYLGQWAPAAGKDAVPAKRYTVNLDLPPEKRWDEVVKDHKNDMQLLISELRQGLPHSLVEMVDLLHIDVKKLLPYPYGYELYGLATAANISEGDALLSALLYELTAYGHSDSKACTSIVAEADNGTIYHARNLDYGMSDVLRNLTIQVDFQENGKTVYTGTTFAGSVGLPTGQKPNMFTIDFNQRNEGKFWMNVFEAIIAGTHGIVTILIRDTLADPEMDFKMAVETLKSVPVIAPCYFIVGGLGASEGAVITRGRSAADDVWWLGSNNSWFLVETNYDHWVPPPKDDDRRDPAIKGMREMGQKDLSGSSLFSVLSTSPVLNAGTTHTVIMSASIPGLYSTWVRHPDTD